MPTDLFEANGIRLDDGKEPIDLFQQAGVMPEAEMTESPRQPLPEESVSEWGKKNPNLWAAAATAGDFIEPLGEAIGMLGGPYGYAIGKKSGEIARREYGRVLGEEPEYKPLAQEMKESAIDVATIKGLDVAFKGAGKALGATTDFLKDAPERLYGSAVKLPLSKKWVRVLPGKEVSERTAAVREGISSKIPPNEYGLAKVKQLKEQVESYINDVFEGATKKGKTFDRDEILSSGLTRAYEKASNSSDPKAGKAIVDKIAEGLKNHPAQIPAKQLNDLKRQLYDEVPWGSELGTGLPGQLTVTAKKGVAHEIMTMLEKEYPELAQLNPKYGPRKDLVEALERSLGREGNKNLIGLDTKVLLHSPKTWPLAFWNSTVGHPRVKAQLAFALAKANPGKYKLSEYNPKFEGIEPTPLTPMERLEEVLAGKKGRTGTYQRNWKPGEMEQIKAEMPGESYAPGVPEKMSRAGGLRPDQLSHIRPVAGREVRLEDTIAEMSKKPKPARTDMADDAYSPGKPESFPQSGKLRPDQKATREVPPAKEVRIEDTVKEMSATAERNKQTAQGILKAEFPGMEKEITRAVREEPELTRIIKRSGGKPTEKDKREISRIALKKMNEFRKKKGIKLIDSGGE